MSFMHRSGQASQQTGGQKAFTWCDPCAKTYRLEFHTHRGRLYQLPLPCGHEYDPEALRPDDQRRCLDCHKPISDDRRYHRCDVCRPIRAKAIQKARNDSRTKAGP